MRISFFVCKPTDNVHSVPSKYKVPSKKRRELVHLR